MYQDNKVSGHVYLC